MATRTWVGNISDNWHEASNWAEGATPVNGDDVIFNSSSGNCKLYQDALSSGRLRTLNLTGFTGILDFNSFKISVGSAGYVAGDLVKIPNTCTILGPGTFDLFSTTSNSTGYNILTLENEGLQNIDFILNSNSFNRYFYIAGNNAYMKDFNTGTYGINLNGVANLNINGDFSTSFPINQSYFFPLKITLPGKNLNFTAETSTWNINGRYFQLQIDNIVANNIQLLQGAILYFIVTNYDISFSANNISGKELELFNGLPNKNINLNINSIDRLKLDFTYSNYINGFKLMNDININDRISFIGEVFNNNQDYTLTIDGNNKTINLSNNCKHIIYNSYVKNLTFSRQITSLYSKIENSNIENIELPHVRISIF